MECSIIGYPPNACETPKRKYLLVFHIRCEELSESVGIRWPTDKMRAGLKGNDRFSSFDTHLNCIPSAYDVKAVQYSRVLTVLIWKQQCLCTPLDGVPNTYMAEIFGS
jgi:sensor domain CHASE-containing protein